MTPATFTTICLLAWAASEALIFARDARPAAGEARDRASRTLIIAAIATGLFIAQWAVHQRFLPLAHDRAPLALAGGLMLLAGIAFRLWAVTALGRHFRTRVTLLADHDLVQSGPYRRIRHPAYTGSLVTCLGYGLGTADGLALFAMAALPLAAYAHRIRIEERALRERFGDRWDARRAATGALFPRFP